MDRTYLTFNKFEEETSDSYSTAHRNSSHNSFGTASSPVLNSPDHNSDSLSDNSKKIRKKRSTYQKIDDATRMRLLDAVQQGETLKAAAKRQGINYSSAKSILHTYRKEGRIFKKSAQERVAKKRTKNSSDLEMSPIYPYKQYGYNDSTEAPQVYGSLELQQNGLYRTDLNDELNGRSGANGVTINSFGDFLKVDSQGRAKSDNSFSSNTITLKLDSQKFQRLPANPGSNGAPVPTLVPVLNAAPAPSNQQVTRNIQSGNWQLNVNIHSEGSQKAAKPVIMKEGPPQFTYTFNTKAPETSQRPETFTMNFSTSGRKDVPADYEQRYINKRYDGVNDMISTSENNQQHYVPEEQNNYDVSCFLNSSSPAYSFPQKTNEGEQIVGNNNNGAENIPGFLESHDLYGKNKEGSYLNNFGGLKLEQRTPEMMKTASLRSY